MYSFEWDEKKNKGNRKKHGISFEEAQTVFYDENALLEYDEDHSHDEDRFRLLGRSYIGNVLLVVYCIRRYDIIRIVSSRKATVRESEAYERRIADE